MRKVSVIILLILTIFSLKTWSQQYVFRVIISNKSLSGYGVEMYYIVHSLPDFADRLSRLKGISEKSVLGLFSMPIVEPGHSEGASCATVDTLGLSLKELFDTSSSVKTLTLEKHDFRVLFDFSPMIFSYCVFPLDRRYFTSYDEENRQAATLISKPLRLLFSSDDLDQIKKIEMIIKRK